MIGLSGINQLDPVQVLEPDRFLGAVADDQTVIGGADSYSSWLAVPGGNRVPHAAVTHVGVLPTHARRGIARGLITAQFEDFARRGEVVATLRASEATIYGRFGYAVASSAVSISVRTARGALLTGVADPGPVTLIDDHHDGPGLVRTIYQDARWAGAVHRTDGWWSLRATQRERDSAPHYLVTFAQEEVDIGYASYRPADPSHWFSSAHREVIVDDFVAHSDAAYLALVRHLLTLDLVDIVTFESRPIDDPLPTLLIDRRAATVGAQHDETWLRLIDVQAALSARAYGPGRPVIIAVTDPLLGANNATFEISAESVRRVEHEPELTVDVRGLAASYLGGTPWTHLALAGLASEHAVGAANAADQLFGTERLPFSGTTF
ncbi:GNAT family N-acetyltransferase [Mycolicibacterium komossense]|uniref:GNAT family N-acetyltransferase n=1 Tax=Mycolicibacterium komossense TaxID=1779 RepID=A0ABT3CFB9_9MYCO|nr:GNAT family N-acetyltransferase [Mycolicibacterium komossense]MCV7228109.1 GNAT family N-acetyltransferase [Mycolicibacterium komossense]